VQVWNDVNLWDKIDRVLRQDYNIEAVIFVLAKNRLVFSSMYVDVGKIVGLHTALEWTSNHQLDNLDFVLDSRLLMLLEKV